MICGGAWKVLIEDFEAIKSRRSANIVLEIIMIVPDNIKQVLPPPLPQVWWMRPGPRDRIVQNAFVITAPLSGIFVRMMQIMDHFRSVSKLDYAGPL